MFFFWFNFISKEPLSTLYKRVTQFFAYFYVPADFYSLDNYRRNKNIVLKNEFLFLFIYLFIYLFISIYFLDAPGLPPRKKSFVFLCIKKMIN